MNMYSLERKGGVTPCGWVFHCDDDAVDGITWQGLSISIQNLGCSNMFKKFTYSIYTSHTFKALVVVCMTRTVMLVSKLFLSWAKNRTNRRKYELSKVSCLELSVTLPITYNLCVHHCTCNYDKFVTSTRFRIIVNIKLVNTIVHPKGNMPDHLYYGNIKCFL